MPNYKGFDKDLKCRDFQYEIGKEYEEMGEIKACANGFHACEMPLDVLSYYPLRDNNRYCLVEQSGTLSKDGDDSKIASSKIKIGAEIGIPGLIRASVEYVHEKCKDATEETASGERGNAAASGVNGNSAASGGRGNAAASGLRGNAAASGANGNAAASGLRGTATVTGEDGSAAALGEQCIATAWGKNCKAKGALGCWLVLTEHYPRKSGIKNAAMFKVDGETIKAETWYTLKDGKPVEV